ncbi:glutathione S-transferase N-terminal domain-containing protein [Vibrio harveyi]
MMTLHTFDSCPYCTRVKALIGLKNLDVKVTTFPLGELEPSVAAKLEKFTVPILQLTSAAEKQTELMT